VAAIGSSLCCFLPIVFALGGFAIVGASALFESLRPYLLAATFALLGAGFYLAYRKPAEECESGSVCARPRVFRTGRGAVWIAAAFAAAFAAFPLYSGPAASLLLKPGNGSALPVSTAQAIRHLAFAIHGMDCPACAQSVESKLSALRGVKRARVSYKQGRAQVEYDDGAISPQQLQQAIDQTGFKATPVEEEK
jgi:copper chaperone CopZ